MTTPAVFQANEDGTVRHAVTAGCEWVMRGYGVALTGSTVHANVPRDLDGLRDWFATAGVDHVVFHHADGRQARVDAASIPPKVDKALQQKALAALLTQTGKRKDQLTPEDFATAAGQAAGGA